MPSGFRETIQFYLIDCKTVLGKLIDIAIILLNLIVCATFAIETYPVSSAVRQLLWNIEVVIVLFFIIEYVARPTLSMLILPAFGIILNVSFLKLLRIFRVFRIFRFLRFTADPEFFFGRITMQLLNIIRLFLVILIIFFISSGLFFYVESGLNPGVKNFGDAFYFTVVSLTTVGFGDIVPISDAGKWVTVLIIISGIILIPWQISRIVREWVHVASKKESVCSGCGLRFHDMDASHCKSCGHIIFQEYDGD
ncbi:MAG: ion transporter [Deltaproteobacteria bacterium]|nr:ion transporter [Deltaproteobacteria bacterium]